MKIVVRGKLVATRRMSDLLGHWDALIELQEPAAVVRSYMNDPLMIRLSLNNEQAAELVGLSKGGLELTLMLEAAPTVAP